MTVETTPKSEKDTNSIGDYLPQRSTNDDRDCGSVACLRQYLTLL